jgi:hypothetical protein
MPCWKDKTIRVHGNAAPVIETGNVMDRLNQYINVEVTPYGSRR